MASRRPSPDQKWQLLKDEPSNANPTAFARKCAKNPILRTFAESPGSDALPGQVFHEALLKRHKSKTTIFSAKTINQLVVGFSLLYKCKFFVRRSVLQQWPLYLETSISTLISYGERRTTKDH